MASVTSDIATILSQYRMMIYHNLETDRDEGLVFVKLGEEDSTGELVRWTGEDASQVPDSDIQQLVWDNSTSSPPPMRPVLSTPMSSPCSSSVATNELITCLFPDAFFPTYI